ncbi:unnamed protein product, partial [Adineta steineri]
NLTLEGVVVALTAILDSQISKQGKYWTALVCDSNQNLSSESTKIGIITSFGLVDEGFYCPKYYSTDIDRNDKTIRCSTCKLRSQNSFEFIVDTSQTTALLQECNLSEVSAQDLIEQESVLLVLASITVVINFNPINKHITNIAINNNEN